MALIKYTTLCIVFTLLSTLCMGGETNKQKQFRVVKSQEGYIVKVGDKVINQLFVLSKHNRDLHLRIVLNHGYPPNNKFIKINYSDFISALSSVLKKVSMVADIRNINSIFVETISLGEENLRITKDYKIKYKKEKIVNPKNIIPILWRSKFISDIQSILSKYNLSVSDIKIEHPFYTDWDEFSSYNITSTIPTELISNKILRCTIYMYFKKNKAA